MEKEIYVAVRVLTRRELTAILPLLWRVWSGQDATEYSVPHTECITWTSYIHHVESVDLVAFFAFFFSPIRQTRVFSCIVSVTLLFFSPKRKGLLVLSCSCPLPSGSCLDSCWGSKKP